MVYFSTAVRGFTNPANGTDNAKGAAYNDLAAKRSRRLMKGLLRELFTVPATGKRYRLLRSDSTSMA